LIPAIRNFLAGASGTIAIALSCDCCRPTYILSGLSAGCNVGCQLPGIVL